jgi:antitoxin MazE
MMVSVVRIGNSRGIRIPQKILSGLNIQDKVEMVIHKDELIIKNKII